MSVAPASSFTKYHWSDRQEGPGSERRTSSGCDHQLENLREKHTKNEQNWTEFSLSSCSNINFIPAYLKG